MAAATKPLIPLKLVVGALTLVAGGVLLADSLGMTRVGSGWALWPLALIGIGLAVRVQPTAASHVAGAVFLVAGVWLVLNELGIWSYPFVDTWPWLLILLGTWMLYRTDRMRQRAGGAGGFDSPTTSASDVGGFAFLSQVDRETSGQRLQRGEISAVLGGCSFDLTDSEPAAKPIVIDAFALAGRVRITVPAGWVVRRRVLPLLGKSDDRRPDRPDLDDSDGPPVDLVVRGTAILGAVEIAPAPGR